MFARYSDIEFHFRFPAGTSRGVLLHKTSSFLILEKDGLKGIGECSTLPGLSIDPMESYHAKLNELCRLLNEGGNPDAIDLADYPSISFGLETALIDLQAKGSKCLFPSAFTEGKTGIPINGLVWMGDKSFMRKQIREKISAGFRCIKLKIGALDFKTELEIISGIRQHFSPEEMEIRLDANGGFTPKEAPEKLKRLSAFAIHSIEQPIKQGQLEVMAALCRESPIPIVLDEELIAVRPGEKEAVLREIKPAYIILKPSLIGGFKQSEEWIGWAKKYHVNWWVTSALESNIGLNAIAQWTYTFHSDLLQGLGTGQLYHNNVQSPLTIEQAKLFYNQKNGWDLTRFL